MSWDGEFVFGPAWAAYRGATDDNALHAHAAIQFVFGLDDDVTVQSDDGVCVRARGIVIRPMAAHAILSRNQVGSIYLEVQSAVALSLSNLTGAAPIASAPAELVRRFDPAAHPRAWLDALSSACPAPSHPLDSRVARTLALLAQQPDLRLPEVAGRAGLSDSQLRALARRQLGVPLSSWLIWRKLDRAALALADGSTLADAAHVAGFADQAHCARTMRRMFGVTLRTARSALAGQRSRDAESARRPRNRR